MNFKKSKELIEKCENFLNELNTFRVTCSCNEEILTQQDWDDANIINHTESLIKEVSATIKCIKEEIE